MINLLLADYPKLLEFDLSYLKASIERWARIEDILIIDDYINKLRNNPELVDQLHQQMMVSYTDFFRGDVAFVYLREVVLPRLIKAKQVDRLQEIRIWSLACSTGQEAYSIAMVLDEFCMHHHFDCKVQLFASDVNEHSVCIAKEGIYSEESIKNLKIKHLDRYFTQIDQNRYQVNEALRSKIHFSVFNLLDEKNKAPIDSVFGGFDVIFCNNILYYYNEKERSKMLEKIHLNLNINAYLFVSPTEKMLVKKWSNYTMENDLSVFKKTINI